LSVPFGFCGRYIVSGKAENQKIGISLQVLLPNPKLSIYPFRRAMGRVPSFITSIFFTGKLTRVIAYFGATYILQVSGMRLGELRTNTGKAQK